MRRKKNQKKESFKLLCDERVPRNIVYAITISIMKHQPLTEMAQREVNEIGRKVSQQICAGLGSEIKKFNEFYCKQVSSLLLLQFGSSGTFLPFKDC